MIIRKGESCSITILPLTSTERISNMQFVYNSVSKSTICNKLGKDKVGLGASDENV